MDSFEVNFAITYLKPQQQKSPCHFRKKQTYLGGIWRIEGGKNYLKRQILVGSAESHCFNSWRLSVFFFWLAGLVPGGPKGGGAGAGGWGQ